MNPRQIIEASLFVSAAPVSLDKLKEVSGLKGKKEVKKEIEALEDAYKSIDSALEIRKIGREAFMMQAKDTLSAELVGLVRPVVSSEILKTLSLIALKQPVLQSEVVKARGQAVYAHVKELINNGFVKATPKGRSKILETSQKFSDYFGFSYDVKEIKKRLAGLLQEG